MFDSAFVRAGSFQLYFGNYYGSTFASLGYRPWFTGYGRYDPAFSYYRWHNRYDDNWFARQRQLYADRGAGRVTAPPRTLAQQHTILANKTVVNSTTINNFRVVAPLSQVKTINNNVNLVKLTPTQLETQKTLMQRTKDIAVVRSKQDGAKVVGPTGTSRNTDAPAFKLPPPVKGPEAARSLENPLPKGVTTKAPVLNNPPKPPSPNIGDKTPPRFIETTPAPKVVKTPEPPKTKIHDAPPMPRNLDVKPAPVPKIVTPPPAPKSTQHESVAPKVIDGPKLRSIDPAPKTFNAPAPHRNLDVRIESPRHVEAPRVNIAPPPVHVSPPPAAHLAPPPPASHASPPPAAPSTTPRSNGKGNR